MSVSILHYTRHEAQSLKPVECRERCKGDIVQNGTKDSLTVRKETGTRRFEFIHVNFLRGHEPFEKLQGTVATFLEKV